MAHLWQYGRMISDRVRTGAYEAALRERVKPGSIVLDIGTGTGVLALFAARLGARRVYAVESDGVIQIARAMARDNHCSDRIEFVQGFSTQVTLPERVDVVVSDLHGVLPLFRQCLPSIVDARRRHLAPGGVLIPERERLWGAIVEAPGLYEQMIGAWDGHPYGLDMTAARERAPNSVSRAQFTTDQMLTPAMLLATLDYTSLEQVNLSIEAAWTVTRAGVGHGMAVWFDALLAPGVAFSSVPGQPELIFGQEFFPWQRPVGLLPGDTVAVQLWATLLSDDYAWTWKTSVRAANDPGGSLGEFEQSTLFAGRWP
jgi:protein arginine N-methyltransferase 1